ncbi:MAG: phosphatase PAP2 family protein [Pseudomonadota bacterium]
MEPDAHAHSEDRHDSVTRSPFEMSARARLFLAAAWAVLACSLLIAALIPATGHSAVETFGQVLVPVSAGAWAAVQLSGGAKVWPVLVLTAVLTKSLVLAGLVPAGAAFAGLVAGASACALLVGRLRSVGYLAASALEKPVRPENGQGAAPTDRIARLLPVRSMGWLLGLTAVAVILFLANPGIDLRVSRAFFDPDAGFFLNDSAAMQSIRETYWTAVWVFTLTALVLWISALRQHFAVRAPAAVWAYAVTAMLGGPGLLSNLILKEYWGRARPADVVEFGGEATFSPALLISDQCARNCSFVSGEGSAIAMVAIVLGSLSWPWLRQRIWPVGVVGLLVAGFGIALRVVMGRHFLSDTVFAILFMALVAFVLFHLLRIGTARKSLTVNAVGADIALFVGYVTSFGRGATLAGDLRRALIFGFQIPAETVRMTLAFIFGGQAR